MPVYHLYNMPHNAGEPDSVQLEGADWPPPEAVEYAGNVYKLTSSSALDTEESDGVLRGAFYTWESAAVVAPEE